MRSLVALAMFAVASARGGCSPPAPAWDPCAGKACGDSCHVCPPDAADCAETAVVKACDADGACVPAPVACGADPCAGKGCGEPCDPCAPGEPCPAIAVVTACDAVGQCVAVGSFSCPAAGACEGKACGDPCTIDPPCAPLCAAPSAIGICDAGGGCGLAQPICPAP